MREDSTPRRDLCKARSGGGEERGREDETDGQKDGLGSCHKESPAAGGEVEFGRAARNLGLAARARARARRRDFDDSSLLTRAPSTHRPFRLPHSFLPLLILARHVGRRLLRAAHASQDHLHVVRSLFACSAATRDDGSACSLSFGSQRCFAGKPHLTHRVILRLPPSSSDVDGTLSPARQVRSILSPLHRSSSPADRLTSARSHRALSCWPTAQTASPLMIETLAKLRKETAIAFVGGSDLVKIVGASGLPHRFGLALADSIAVTRTCPHLVCHEGRAAQRRRIRRSVLSLSFRASRDNSDSLSTPRSGPC